MMFSPFYRVLLHVSKKLFLVTSLLFVLIATSGCALYQANERLDSIEARLDNLQVYDVRMGNLEERLDDIESDIGVINSALPIRKIKGTSAVAELKKHTASAPVSHPTSASTAENTVAETETSPIKAMSRSKENTSISKEIDTIVDSLHEGKDAPLASITPMQMAPSSRAVTHASPPQKAVKHARKEEQARPKGEQARYAAALKLYEQNKFNEAEKSFSAFLKDFPKSRLAPNAMYWFAECSYSKNDYATAVVNFKNVAARYPKHDKAAAALYKLGLCYKKMNDMDNANFYWGILQSDFPMSEPTRLIGKQ